MPAGTLPRARLTPPSIIYDPVRRRLLVFGGFAGDGSLSDDVWALSLAGTPAWNLLFPTDRRPAGGIATAPSTTPCANRMLIFGGHDYYDYHNDVWALSLAAPRRGRL